MTSKRVRRPLWWPLRSPPPFALLITAPCPCRGRGRDHARSSGAQFGRVPAGARARRAGLGDARRLCLAGVAVVAPAGVVGVLTTSTTHAREHYGSLAGRAS